MRRLQQTGMVNCADNWAEINTSFTPPDNTAFSEPTVDVSAYSFRVSAFRGGDSIVFDYNGITGITSNIVVVGDLFSNTDSSLLRVLVSGLDGSVKILTDSTSLTIGDISLQIERLGT